MNVSSLGSVVGQDLNVDRIRMANIQFTPPMDLSCHCYLVLSNATCIMHSRGAKPPLMHGIW